jgi:class 3 adenylate cyclase
MVGTAVIAAARLSSVAAADQILLMPRSFTAVEGLVIAEPVGEIQLKGFSHPVAPINVVGLRDGVLEATTA